MGEFAAIVSALVSGLSLMLGEIRRRRHQPVSQDLRGALVDLCLFLAEWHDRARDTNWNARQWANALPASAGSARQYLEAVVEEQRGAMEHVRDTFDQPLITNPQLVGQRERPLTVEGLLRIYAPQLLELAPLMVERQRQLKDGVAEELERRYRDEGLASLHSCLLELEYAADGLGEVRRLMWEFLRHEFPLGDPQAPST